MRSPSRARVDCQWKAKPRISTTKPVVADSVIDSAASDPHSGSFFSWITMTWPGSDLTACDIAIARTPFGRIMSLATPCRPGSASNCAVEITSRMRSLAPALGSAGTRASTRCWVAAVKVMMMCRPVAAPGTGSGPAAGFAAARRWRCGAADRRRGVRDAPARMSVRAARSPSSPARFCTGLLVDHLHEGAEADGDQEGDDQRRHGATKRRLGDPCGDRPVSRSTAPALDPDRIGRTRSAACARAMPSDPHRDDFRILFGRGARRFRDQSGADRFLSGCRINQFVNAK